MHDEYDHLRESADAASRSEITVPAAGRPTEPISGSALVGVDTNAFAIMARTRDLLKRGGASMAYREAYLVEATSGDWDHLLAASVAYLEAEQEMETETVR